jgi:D-lactate dehydrogenase
MKVAVFSTKTYDKQFFDTANQRAGHALTYLEPRLTEQTASLADGFPAVCVFVNDILSAEVLRMLSAQGTGLIALRCAGFNNVDLKAAREVGISVARVPAYSPYAVAEHTVGLMLALNRKIHRAYARVREGNFALDGLLGFDMRQKVVGIIGTGQIGTIVARILSGFGCKLIAHDPYPNKEIIGYGAVYVPLIQLLEQSDIITLHCPLMPATYHLIGKGAFERMKDGVMLINTSRGALIDTPAAIEALKEGKIAYLGLDVYEEEGDLFFEDLSDTVIQDDVFSRLLTFPNIIITGHQAFFTSNALTSIAETTLSNISEYESKQKLTNEVSIEYIRG